MLGKLLKFKVTLLSNTGIVDVLVFVTRSSIENVFFSSDNHCKKLSYLVVIACNSVKKRELFLLGRQRT